MKVTTAKAEQTAIPELGKDAKTLYYLIVGEGEKKVIVNVGEKTYKGVQNLIEEEPMHATREQLIKDKDDREQQRKLKQTA